MCQTTNELKEFHKFQLMVLLIMFLFIDYRHLAVTKAEKNVFLADAEIGVARTQIDTVFKVHELLSGRPEPSVDGFKTFQVALKQVVHINSPKFFVTEFLPWIRRIVRDNAFSYQFLGSLSISLNNLWLSVLTVCETDQDFEEFKPLQAIRGSCGLFCDLQVRGDERPVDTCNVDLRVEESCFSGEVAEVKLSNVGPR